ncbi:MAG: response regulator [Thermodesulfobacteriota bacterium]|nr:response regulator [Thermodesulfobacteriota bacterium]
MTKRRKFGEVLIEEGVIDAAMLQLALKEQAASGKRLGQILEEQDIISERDITMVLARQFGLKTVKNISEHKFSASLLDLIDSEKALQKLIFPLRIEGKTLYLAMVNPLDMETLDTLSFGTGLRIVPYLTTPQEIHSAINKHYLEAMNAVAQGDWWRIMVFDNQELALSATSVALSKEGFEVIKVSKADTALTIIHQKLPHLIVTEISMPGIGGVELFNSLKKNPKTEHIPMIAYSNRSTADEEAKLLDLGFIDFIAKPVNAVRLVARTKRALRLSYNDLEAPSNI